mgnify:CR=1 FL=1
MGQSTARGTDRYMAEFSWTGQGYINSLDDWFSFLKLLCGGFGSFKQSLENRVLEIHRLVKSSCQWNNYPSESNPSNICSRGSLISKLVNNHLSWVAPRFFRTIKNSVQVFQWTLLAWGPFLESPETLQAHFGWHISICIFKAKGDSRHETLQLFYFIFPLQHEKASFTG